MEIEIMVFDELGHPIKAPHTFKRISDLLNKGIAPRVGEEIVLMDKDGFDGASREIVDVCYGFKEESEVAIIMYSTIAG